MRQSGGQVVPILRQVENPLPSSVFSTVDPPLNGLRVREPAVVPPDLELFHQVLAKLLVAIALSASLLDLS